MVFDTLDQLEMYIPVLPSIRLIADIMDHDDLYEMPCGTYRKLPRRPGPAGNSPSGP